MWTPSDAWRNGVERHVKMTQLFYFELTRLGATKRACRLDTVLVACGQREREKRVKP